MAIHIPTFPVLTDELAKSSGFKVSDPTFYYHYVDKEKGEDRELATTDSFFHALFDRHGIWTADGDQNLKIKGSIEFTHACELYGPNGIAPASSNIGIGLRWCSAQSKQRGTERIAHLKNKDGKQFFTYEHSFRAGQLRGQVNFSIVLYLKENCNPAPEEIHLARTQGTIIGESTPFILKIDGVSPDIAIIYFEDEEAPLWDMEVNCQNPIEMPMDSDALKIRFNKKHENFKYIDQQNNQYVPAMLSEVLSSALTIFVNSLRSEADDECCLNNILEDNLDQEPKPGSIADSILKFQNELHMDLTTPTSTAISFKKYFDAELKDI